MNKVIVYTEPTTGVAAIIKLIESARPQHIELKPMFDGKPIEIKTPYTDAEFYEHVAQRFIPVGVEYKIIDASELPPDRRFRNAWEI